MLNINKGHNPEIMDKCQALSQYSDFIAKVKEYNRSLPIKESIIKAIEMSKAYKFSKEDAIQQLITNYKLTEAEAIKAVDKHWK